MSLAACQFALAQDAEKTKSNEEKTEAVKDEVVILDAFKVYSGFSGSLAAATELKQSMSAVVEVVAAEDIGKLPDISIADSLTRLTGLTTQRLNGRSQAISIRGMTGDFSTGLLNGREQVSTNSNRAVEFDQYPAELLTGAVVYKTTDASLIGQGLAGTVDLRTVRPLSQSKRTVMTNVFYDWTQYGELNAGSDRGGIRYTASYIDQFDNGKVGVALGFASADKPGQGKQWNAWGYPTVTNTAGQQAFVLGGAKPFVRSSSLERDGFMGVFEYKPQKDFHLVVDLYRSKFDETQQLRGIEIPLAWSSAQLQPGYTYDNGLLTKGVFKNVYGVVRNDVVFRKADVWAAGVNAKLSDLNDWTIEGDISFSKINRKDTVLETYSGTAANQVGTADTMGYSLEGGTGAIFTPTIDYTNASLLKLTSPQGWGGDIVPGGQVGYLKVPEAKDELKQAKVSAKHPLKAWIFKTMEFGASFSERTKSENDINPAYLALANGATSAPLPAVVGITDLSFIGIKGMASYDPLAALDSGVYKKIRNPNADVVSVDWKVKEQVGLAYAQLGIDDKIGTMPFTGNLGFQLIASDQNSKGLSATGTGSSVKSVAVSGGTNYLDFVPSFNSTLKLAERRFLRFSVARQLARQRMSDMRAGQNYSFNSALVSSTDPQNGPWSGSGGNPALKPWRANSVDLSLEQYFADNMGYVSLAGFYKKLVSYTYNRTTLADFTGYPSTATPAIYKGTVSIPQNGEGGYMRGLELTISLPSEMISKSIKGFGLVAGGALTDSSIQPDLSNPAVMLPGLSKKVATLTFYYDHKGFSARVSQRYRSEYRANIDTFGPRGENFRTVQAETVYDAQVSYAFQSGPFKGLTLIVQGNNLSDEPLATYQGYDSRLVQDYQRYGRSYSAGVSYKF